MTEMRDLVLCSLQLRDCILAGVRVPGVPLRDYHRAQCTEAAREPCGVADTEPTGTQCERAQALAHELWRPLS